MIVYTPLWRLMKERGYTTYTLQAKFGIGGGQIQRLKRNQSVSTNTLDDLCKFMDCDLPDIVQYIPDDEPPWPLRGEDQ